MSGLLGIWVSATRNASECSVVRTGIGYSTQLHILAGAMLTMDVQGNETLPLVRELIST